MQQAQSRKQPKDPNQPKIYPRWWQPYFAALAISGTHKGAVEAAEIDHSTPYKFLEFNPSFREEFEFERREAHEAATDSLMNEARRRALEGWNEPVIHQGRRCYERDPTTGNLVLDANGDPIPLTVRRQSEKLLMFAYNNSERGYKQRLARATAASGVNAADQAKLIKETLISIGMVMGDQMNIGEEADEADAAEGVTE